MRVLFISLPNTSYVQVTGEAVYTDDIPTPPRGLYAAFVLSTKSHAEILHVDPAKALAHRGVVAFFGASDIPGANQVGPVFNDEELFASKEVHCVGFVIGVVVADTHQNAVDAAKLVHVDYKDLHHITTIEVYTLFSLQLYSLKRLSYTRICSHNFITDNLAGVLHSFIPSPKSNPW